MTSATLLQDRVARLEAELAAARREMQDLTATVSHDLRAPLRHILAYAQLVQEDAGPQLSAEVQGFLGTITDSAKHLGMMLDALLELSRVGTVRVQLEPLNLHEVLQGVIEHMEQQHAAISTLQPMWRLKSAAALRDCTVQADPALLVVVLEQVLGNALKFTHPGVLPSVRLSLTPQGGVVQLVVQDQGVGFDPARAQTLCQPFVRLHSSRQFGGLGMGLTLARKAMQRIGGNLEISAEPDVGCKVALVLTAL